MGNHNEYNRNENCILVSNSGSYAGYLSKYSIKVWASDCFSIEPKNNKINNDYLWYYLKFNQENIYKLQHGNGQPHVNTTDVETFLLPNLPPSHQQEIVEFLDEIYKTNSINDTIKYMKDYPIFNLLIDKNYSGFKQVIWFQENIPRLMAEMENIPKKKNYYIQGLFNTVMLFL
jgi:restriction endonuclease S subunit